MSSPLVAWATAWAIACTVTVEMLSAVALAVPEPDDPWPAEQCHTFKVVLAYCKGHLSFGLAPLPPEYIHNYRHTDFGYNRHLE